MKYLYLILFSMIFAINTQGQEVFTLGSDDPDNPQKLLIEESGITGKAGQKLLINGYVEISHIDENIYTEDAKRVYLKFDSVQFVNSGIIYTKSDLGIYPTKYLGGHVRIKSIRGKAGEGGTSFDTQAPPITKKAPSGSHGSHGKSASCGTKMDGLVPKFWNTGCDNGRSGGAGQKGYKGNDGSNGGNGTDGAHSSNILIELNKISLDENLFIDIEAEGGDGGNGGNGQKGGVGGEGGNGGKGGNGGNGNECGRSACDGGRGGNAGNGGNGGDGGDGGNGGKGGNGGLVEIYFSDPQMQIFLFQGMDKRVLAKYKGGKGGRPGIGGEGGEGGRPGSRGCGGGKGHAEGLPNVWLENGDNGDCGNTGKAGNVGVRGKNGEWGMQGQDGMLRHSNYKYVEERSTDFFNMPQEVQGEFKIL